MVGDRPQPSWRQNHNHRFIPSDLRVNYPDDTPGLAAHARIDSFRSTWPADADYTEMLQRIDSAEYVSGKSHPDFYFALPGNRIITTWDELALRLPEMPWRSTSTRAAGSTATLKELDSMRMRYAGGDRAAAGRITSMEQEGRTRAYSPARDVQQSSARK